MFYPPSRSKDIGIGGQRAEAMEHIVHVHSCASAFSENHRNDTSKIYLVVSHVPDIVLYIIIFVRIEV